ncbi:MAG TPA: GtrA family protein [Ohtaekwangia sp.]
MIKYPMENLNRLLKAEFARFVVVGGISAVLEYSLYFVFKTVVDYLIANILAFALTNIVTYILSKRYVFNSNNENKVQMATLFAICLMGALLVNQIVLWALVEFVTVDDKIAKAIAIAVTVIWNFFTRKHFVFKNRAVATQEAPTDFPSDKI